MVNAIAKKITYNSRRCWDPNIFGKKKHRENRQGKPQQPSRKDALAKQPEFQRGLYNYSCIYQPKASGWCFQVCIEYDVLMHICP